MRGSGRLPGCEYGVFGSTEDVLRRRIQEADAAVAARVASIARTGLDAVELEVKEHLEEHLDDFVIQMSHAYKGCIQNGPELSPEQSGSCDRSSRGVTALEAGMEVPLPAWSVSTVRW